MAEFIPCVYCLENPPLDKTRKGKIERCPLCKTENLVTPSGATYRLRTPDGDEIHAPPSRVNRLLAFLGIGGSAMLVAAWCLLWQGRSSPGMPPPRAAIPQEQPSEEPKMPETLPLPREWTAPKGTAKVAGHQLDLAAKKTPSMAMGQVKAFKQPPPPDPIVLAQRVELTYPPVLHIDYNTENHFRIWLAKVPEVSLQENYGSNVAEATGVIKKLAEDISEQNKRTTDGFIHHLKEKRADLTGLPFLLSPGCQLEIAKARDLQRDSGTIRMLLDRSRSAFHHSQQFSDFAAGTHFWIMWRSAATSSSDALPRHLPALLQILQPEEASYRQGLIRNLHGIPGEQAGSTLARLAVFDTDLDNRKLALEALGYRPRSEYCQVLLQGMHYPWPPVVANAAAAIVNLKCDDLVAQLIDLLDGPEPTSPYPKKIGSKVTSVVREVVRINHHRNCLLCHAPSSSPDFVRAPVPNPYRPLPQSSAHSYQGRAGDILVRADVTYLRQDFSLLLEVNKADAWPIRQRFDFLVREPAATPKDQTAVGPSEYHQVVLQVLRQVTGHDAGFSAASWRIAMATATGRNWKSVCNK